MPVYGFDPAQSQIGLILDTADARKHARGYNLNQSGEAMSHVGPTSFIASETTSVVISEVESFQE